MRLTVFEVTAPKETKRAAHVAMSMWLTKGMLGSAEPKPNEHTASVVSGTTDEQGVLSTTVIVPREWCEALEHAQGSSARDASLAAAISIHARPQEPGFRHDPRGFSLSMPLPEVVEKRLRLRRGGNLLVVTRHGGELRASEVRLLHEKDAGTWRSKERADVLKEGHYSIEVEEPGRYAVTARARGIGTAWAIVDYPQDFAAAETIELDLEGTGTLTGRLIDPGGAPILDHGVRAIQTRIDGATHLSTNQQLDHERGKGCVNGTAQTNADGEFRITGLEPGDYRLLGWDHSTWGDPRHLAEQVATGSGPHVYTMERHALVIKVEDDRGMPVEILGHEEDRRWSFPNQVLVYCYPRVLDHGERRRPLWSTPSGDYLIAQLQPDREYVLGVHSSRHAPMERIVRMSITDYQEEVTLRLGSALEPASLQVTCRAPGGDPVKADLLVTVRTQSGYSLEEAMIVGSSSVPLTMQLPPGGFVLRVEEKRFPRYVPVEKEMQLVPGESRVESLELGAAGSIAVEPKAAGPPGPYAQATTRQESIARMEDGTLYGRVAVKLTPAGGGDVLHLTFPPQGPIYMSHQGPDPGLPFGTSLNATQRIAVGDYTVQLTALGYEPVERQITIAKRKRKRIKVTMIPVE